MPSAVSSGMGDSVPYERWKLIDTCKVSTTSFRVIGISPPVKAHRETCKTCENHQDITVCPQKFCARTDGSAEKGRDRPREPVSPSREGRDLRKYNDKYQPTE